MWKSKKNASEVKKCALCIGIVVWGFVLQVQWTAVDRPCLSVWSVICYVLAGRVHAMVIL